MALAIDARFGVYTIIGKLGQGGMGEVYRARDTRLNSDVAIKILPEMFAADGERTARFRHEAKTLASLNHPNIGSIHGPSGSVSGCACVRQAARVERRRHQAAVEAGRARTVLTVRRYSRLNQGWLRDHLDANAESRFRKAQADAFPTMFVRRLRSTRR